MNILYIAHSIPESGERFEICHSFDKDEAIKASYNIWHRLTVKEQKSGSIELSGYCTEAENAEEAYKEIIENTLAPDTCEKIFYGMRRRNLTGQTFGQWTALTPKKMGWLCRCSCGTERIVKAFDLINGVSKSCGHPRYKVGDIVLGYKVIELISPGHGTIYRCKCMKCGEVVEKKEISSVHFCRRQDNIDEKLAKYYVDGTGVQNLKSALDGVIPKNNTTGVRGVYFDKSINMYKAIIKFKQKNYYLGSGSIEHCTKLRKEAEIRIYGNFLEWYKNLKSSEEVSMTIKEMRTACGMTQAQFSEYLGIPKRTIENWEEGKTTVPEYVVRLIRFRLTAENKIQ